MKILLLLLGSLVVLASSTRLDNLSGHVHEEFIERSPNNNLVHIRYGTEHGHGLLGHSGSRFHSQSDSQSHGFSHLGNQQGLIQHNDQYQRYSSQGQDNRNRFSALNQQSNRNQFSQGQQFNRNEYTQSQDNRNQFFQGQQSNRNQFSQQSNRNQLSFQDQQSNRYQFSNQQPNRNLVFIRDQVLNDNQNRDQFSIQNQQSFNSQYSQRNNVGSNQRYSTINTPYSPLNVVVARANEVSTSSFQNRGQDAQFRSAFNQDNRFDRTQNQANRFQFNDNENRGNRFRFDQNQANRFQVNQANRFFAGQNQGNRRISFNQNNDNNRFQFNQNQENNRFRSNLNQATFRTQSILNRGDSAFQNQGSRFQDQAFGQQGRSSSFRNEAFGTDLARQDQRQQVDTRFQSGNNRFQHSGNQFQASSQQTHSNDRQFHQSQNFHNNQFNSNLQTSQRKEIAGYIENTSGNKVLGVFQTFSVPASSSLAEGQVSSSFSCSNYGQGYYADPESSCRMFHVCTPVQAHDGSDTQYRFTFRCGEGEEFDQTSLTCTRSSSSCSRASSLFGSSKERSQHLFSGFSSSVATGPCYLASDNIITGLRRK